MKATTYRSLLALTGFLVHCNKREREKESRGRKHKVSHTVSHLTRTGAPPRTHTQQSPDVPRLTRQHMACKIARRQRSLRG